MVGITLSPEQIRSAPIEVRRWIEREFARSMGLQEGDDARADQLEREHLVACTIEEAGAVLSLIRGMLPVVNVFFELGRKGTSLPAEGLEAFRLADMLHHTRLQHVGQVITCLDAINEAMRRVTGDTGATLFALDSAGDCFVAIKTQQSILRLWQETIRGQAIASIPERSATGSSAAPFATSFPSNAVRSDRSDMRASPTSSLEQGSESPHLMTSPARQVPVE